MDLEKISVSGEFNGNQKEGEGDLQNAQADHQVNPQQ